MKISVNRRKKSADVDLAANLATEHVSPEVVKVSNRHPGSSSRNGDSVAIYRGDPQNTGFYRTKAARMLSDKPTWVFRAKAPISCCPVIAGAVVYVGTERGILHAIDRVTGKEKWRFDAHSVGVQSPAISGKYIFLVAGAGLFVLDTETGIPISWDERFAEVAFFSTPRTGNRSVFIGGDEFFLALDVQSLEPRWINNDWGEAFVSTPILHNGVLSAVAYDATIVGIDAKTGQGLWQVRPEGVFNQYDPVCRQTKWEF